MKNLIFTIWMIVLTLTININRSTAQWVQTGPYSGSYTVSSTNGNRLFLGVLDADFYNKIMLSSDNGANWNTMSFWLYMGVKISSLKATETYLFKGESDGIIQRSSNNGLNWEFTGNGIPSGSSSVSVIETCNGILFTGITSYGIYRSTDNGENWVNVNSSVTINSTIVSLVFNGNYIFAADKDYNIFRADASGENWTNVYNNTAISFKNIINFGPALLASTSTNGILKSTNEGTSWEFTNEGLSNLSVSCIKSFDSNLFASTLGGGVFISSDNGTNWRPVNYGLQRMTVSDLFISNTRIFAGTGVAGIFYSTNSGENWHNSNVRVQTLNINSMCSNNFFIFSCVIEGVFRSSDNGNTWIFSDIGLQNSHIYSLTTKGNMVICGTNSNGVFRSSDNGISWEQINNGLGENLSISALASNNNYIYTASGYPGKLFKSSDNGDNWLSVSINTSGNSINQIISSESNLFVSTFYSVIYSSDNGNSWRNSDFNDGISDLTYNGFNLFVSFTNSIYRSSNNGITWISTYSGVPEPLLFTLESYGNNIFAGGLDNILYSSNNGQNWKTINEGLIQALADRLWIQGNNIYLHKGWGQGIWIRSLSEIIEPLTNDVGVISIIEPNVDSAYYVDCLNNKIVIPKITLKNFGSANQNNFFDVHFEIKQGDNILYTSTKQDTITSGQTHTLNFDPYTVAFDFSTYNMNLKTFSMKSWTSLLSDSNHANDQVNSTFTVNNPNYGYSDISGYYFLNSSSNAGCIPDQPVFHWEDTTGSVNLITNGVIVVPYTEYNSFYFSGCYRLPDVLPDGNKFKFFGTCYDTIVIATNGIIGLGGSMTGMNIPFPVSIPSASAPKPAIFPFWYWCNFLDPEITGRNLKYKVTADKFIVTYDRVPIYNTIINSLDYLSYQVILEIGPGCGIDNGKITVQFDDSKSGSYFLNNYYNGNLNANTVGIQDASGTIGIQYRRSDSPGHIPVPGPLFGSPLAITFGQINELLPVELMSFTSFINENNVTLNWQTNSETNNSGFTIERSSVKNQWNNLGFIKGSGNTNSATEYAFTDKDLVPGKYNYRLKQIDFNGSFEYFDLTSEVIIGVPEKYELSQNYPNPFNPVTNLEFGIPELGFLTLKVYDVLGKEVKTLVNEIKSAGRYRIEFDGSSFASGVYFYELRAGNFVSQKRMLLLK